MTSVAELIRRTAEAESMSAGQTAPRVPGHRRPIVLKSTGAPSCDSKLADDPWAVDRDPGYGPGASAADGVPSSAPRQGPLPERYTRASDEQLDRWILAAKETLGDRVQILGHF